MTLRETAEFDSQSAQVFQQLSPDIPERAEQPEINVGGAERIASFVAGAGLVLFGLQRRSVPGLTLAGAGAALIQRGASGQCAVYRMLGIDSSRDDEQITQSEEYFRRGIHVAQSVTINKSPAELFSFWRNLTNLPRFMDHLERVDVADERHSHWVAKAPAGYSVQWDAEIINEEPDQVIAWRSLPGADVDNSGSVRFVPLSHDRGTQVNVVIDYIPPAGRIGWAVAKLFGEEPQQQVNDDLRRFKWLMETGTIPTTDGQPRGSKC